MPSIGFDVSTMCVSNIQDAGIDLLLRERKHIECGCVRRFPARLHVKVFAHDATTVAVWPEVASIPLRKRRLPV
jgi:hypothetical protein